MNMWQKGATATLVLLVAATSFAGAAPRPVSAQDGWLAWQGCWRAAGDPQNQMLCIVPDGDGARMIEVLNGAAQQETRIVANGAPQRADREGCRGTEQALWSKDQQRLFTVSAMTCGEQMLRKVTGIMSMISPSEWVSVQAVTSGKQTIARTKRYQAVPRVQLPQFVSAVLSKNALAAETARYAAANELDLTDVVEAVKTVEPEVVNEWLTATGQRFELTGKKLVALADAGVPISVIDVLVAVSNPEHFAVKPLEERPIANYDRPRGGGGGYDPCYDSWYGPYGGYPSWYGGYGYGGYAYGRYGYNYNGCYYSPWGYDPWGWRRGGTIVVVRDGNGDEPGGSNQPARATRGGYSGGSSSGSAHPRGSSGSQPSGTATPRASGGGSSGGSSSGGHSAPAATGGGYTGGTSTGAVAKPKDK